MKDEANPLVSIVVCTYNGEKYLGHQLESILNQTYQNTEILISDDNSTDGTVSIARSYAAKDQRVRVHVNSSNLGYNQNFEQAFLKAGGDFIAVSDQDDIWKKDKIEKLMRLFTTADTLLVFCQSVQFTDKIPQIDQYTKRHLFQGRDIRQLMYFNTIAGHNMIFRKKLLEHAVSFPPKVYYDWWLGLIASAYGRVSGINDVLTFHRFHASNVTLGKKDEKYQTRYWADNRRMTLEHLLKQPGLTPEERSFAKALHNALLTLNGKEFSFTLFSFLLRHAGTVFFFKKGSFFSKLKMAYRLSFAK